MKSAVFPAEYLPAFATGTTPIDLLRSAQYGKRLLLLRGIADRDGTRSRPGFDLLRAMSNRAPEAVKTTVRHPSVGGWAQDTYFGAPGIRPGGMDALAAAAAVRAGATAEMDLAVHDGAVVLPSLGQAEAPREDTVRFVADGRSVSVGAVRLPADVAEPVPGWQPLRTLEVGTGLLVDDLDPHRLPQGHLAGRLAATDLPLWSERIGGALKLLARHHPGVAREVAALVLTIVPLRLDPHGRSVSATSPKTFGAIGMSAPIDARWTAVTFAHEIQHMKLAALTELVDLTHPDDGRLFYAPWRDDPRPASGLLHGLFAFSGVAAFWHRQRHHESGEPAFVADTEFARWRTAVLRCARTLLESGALTAAGTAFVTAISDRADDWRSEPLPSKAIAAAERAATDHRSRWRQ
jgi:HEXXH motif-containing protein